MARDCSMTVRKKAEPEYSTLDVAGKTATDRGVGCFAPVEAEVDLHIENVIELLESFF